ncbi:MAG: PIN domain-containing protein [Conexivisphaerales archaeon]
MVASIPLRYVVDTTELVRFMLNPDGSTGRIIRSFVLDLYTPYRAIDEIWKHRNEWLRRRPALSLQNFIDLLGNYIKVIMVDQNSGLYQIAVETMSNIDPNDTEFLALALNLKLPIWTEDSDFTRQELVNTVTTMDIVHLSSKLPDLWQALHSP